MKRKIAAVSVILLCLAIVSSGSLAFFTAEEKTDNVISMGNLGIYIINQVPGEDGTLVDLPDGKMRGGLPGTEVAKFVSVKNDGGKVAWIRLRIEDEVLDQHGNPLPTVLDNGKPVLSFELSSEHWFYLDGWYYYDLPVDPDQVTETLYEAVCFAPEMDNDYVRCTANHLIFAQAVQYENNGETILEAKGWPED